MVLRSDEQALMLFRGGCISGTEYNRNLKLSMQTHQTHTNTVFEYCHASVILDNINVLYLEDLNEYRSAVKNKTATMFFSLKTFSSS